jgi:hypothetical protein
MKSWLIAAAAAALFAGTASAAPIHPSAGVGAMTTPRTTQVDWRDRNRHRNWRGGHHGRRHGPPPGWRRYHTRPWDWQRRGCMAIGPVWFCP